jgi:Glycosyltransferase family 92
MKIVKYLIFLVLPIFTKAETYKLVIGSMFKNEAPYLKEWIEYHKLIGFEHFYLYDNESTDEFMQVLSPYIEHGLVDLIPWSCTPEHWKEKDSNSIDYVSYQYGAFDNCINSLLGIAKWVGLFDIDEFLLPLQGPEIGIDYLHQMLDNAPLEIGTFAFLMTDFGTSHVEKIPFGNYITDVLVHRQYELFKVDNNSSTKCIHRPEAVMRCKAHHAILKNGFRLDNVAADKIRINHYFTRDIQSCFQKRGRIDDYEWMNYLYDDSFVPFTKILMELDSK